MEETLSYPNNYPSVSTNQDLSSFSSPLTSEEMSGYPISLPPHLPIEYPSVEMPSLPYPIPSEFPLEESISYPTTSTSVSTSQEH